MAVVMAAQAVIDTSCPCDHCTSRTTAMYDLPGRCLNCGVVFTVRSRKGDMPPLSVECPSCEVAGYSWRTYTAVEPIPEDDPTVDVRIPDMED